MEIAILVVFVIGYVLIAFEHSVHINKSATALLTGVLCWTIYALSSPGSIHHIGEQLEANLGESAAIIFFLLGAMTIVELIDAYQGFDLLTSRITTKNPKILLSKIRALGNLRVPNPPVGSRIIRFRGKR